ncbi:MAG: serine/threonine-protein kinase [Sporichthyaceae bacterium]
MTEPAAAPRSPGHPGALMAGVQLGAEGRYTLTDLLGTGGMASVWTARDARLDRTVAIKIISDNLALDPAFVERFAREARLAAGLAHPHVVAVHDYGNDGGRPYLVMEYIPGGTLADRMREGRAGWVPSVLARELLDALGYIHAAGILHRDLKPANVLIGSDGRARLTDFGIAHLVDGTRITSTGLVMGTERYAAPEVLRGSPASTRSDLYACGVLLRQCAGADPSLRSLLDALTREDPDQRPADAADAARLIGSIAGPDEAQTALLVETPVQLGPEATKVLPPTLAQPRSPAGPSSRPSPGAAPVAAVRRALPWAGAAVVLLVLGALALGGGDEPQPLELPPDSGSVAEQLDSLERLVDGARR